MLGKIARLTHSFVIFVDDTPQASWREIGARPERDAKEAITVRGERP
jgi:hypothetical protein